MAVNNRNGIDKVADKPNVKKPATGTDHAEQLSTGQTGNPTGKTASEPQQTAKAYEASLEKKAKVKRSKFARNPLVILVSFVFTFIFFTTLLGGLGVYLGKKAFEDAGPLPEARVILINSGTSIGEIASILQNEGTISSSWIFTKGVKLHQKAGMLKAGEYEIPAHASMQQIMDILVAGRSIEHPFTVPEGLTVVQVFDRLRANELLTGDLPMILPDEGSLLADTIMFVRGTPKIEIVRRLQNGQRRLLEKIWAGRNPNLPLKNINELITLASIVEKETGIASERPQVAAVFYNRLKKNMRLQSDPTVLYGLFGGAGKPADRPIYRSDLEKETPFNTYRINGLPPSPIAIPGRDSLKAVANPPHTGDLYFVADGTGGHVFSKTLNEHNSNVQKWRRIRQAQDAQDSTSNHADDSDKNQTENPIGDQEQGE